MLFIARDIIFPFCGNFLSFLRHFFTSHTHKWASKDTDIIIGPVETTEMSDGATEGEERGNDDDDDDEGWRFASKLAPFVQNGNFRMQLEIDTRFVVLMMSSEKDFVCFDATCYHMGAPLLHADIEDLSRRAPCDAKDEKKKSCVVVCPWHHYKIDVGLGGERVYFDAFTKERKTVARRQRTHEVKVDDDENVYIKLNKEEESYESDRYAHKQPLKSSRSSDGNIGSGYNRYAGTGERNRGRAFKSSGEAFITSSGGSGGMKKREESVLGQMVGKSMSGGDGVAPWAVSKEAKMSPPPPPPPRGILKKSSFSTSRLMSTKGNRESIIEEREKEKEVFEDAEEEMVG